MSLSCSGIPRRLSQQWYLSHPVPLGSSGLGPFLSLSLFLKTLTVMRSTAQGFCRPSLNEYLSNIFLLIRLGLIRRKGFITGLGRKITEEKFQVHHIRSRGHGECTSSDICQNSWTVDHQARTHIETMGFGWQWLADAGVLIVTNPSLWCTRLIMGEGRQV